MQQVLLDEAIAWWEKGVSVIPVKWGTKLPDWGALRYVGSVNSYGAGSWEPYKTRLPNADELVAWFGSRYRRNIGIVTGWQGLTVIDFDDWATYADWCSWAAQYAGLPARVLAETYQVITARGVHVYVWADVREDFQIHTDAVSLDVKGCGGYVLGPGSLHPSGVLYEALNEAEPVHVPAARAILSRFILSDRLPAAPPARPQTAMRDPTPAVANDPWAAAEHPTNLMARAKAACRIEDLVPLVRHTGDGWGMAVCPLHDDHEPSLSVNLTGQWASCRAGCNQGRPMDVVNLVALREGWTMTQAAQYLVSRQLRH